MSDDDALYCPQCNNKYRVFDECPECLVKLQRPSIQQNIHGDKHQAVIINGENSGSIHLGHTDKEEPDTTTYIHRTHITPIKIGSTPVKSWWSIAVGALGIVGSIASIIGVLASVNLDAKPPLLTSPPLFMLLAGGSMMFLLAGLLIRRSKYLKLPFITLEIDRHGNVYKTAIGGECGLCKNPVKLTNKKSGNSRCAVIECTYNPDQHWMQYDPTVLNDVGDDFRNRR